jgi:hypothetical protein
MSGIVTASVPRAAGTRATSRGGGSAAATGGDPRAANADGSVAGRTSSVLPASRGGQATLLAAARIIFSVAAGWEIIGTCDALTLYTCACARAAMNSCVLGGIA